MELYSSVTAGGVSGTQKYIYIPIKPTYYNIISRDASVSFQTAVLRAADQRGDRAAAQAAGSAEKVRVRDTAVFRHSRLQRLLCRSRGLERRHENRPNAQPALHGFRRAHRPEEKPKRLQGIYCTMLHTAAI